MTTLIMLAKECVPGRAKTRLHPPLSLVEAAEVAAACISMSAEAVDRFDWTRRVLCFDGKELPGSFPGWEVHPQADGGLDERIAAVLDICRGPTVLIGMDSPHLDPGLLEMLSGQWPDDIDAWFGPAVDGGFWLLGLREPDGDLVRGVPMSREDTGTRQLQRLTSAGLRTAPLPAVRDIDTIDDLRAAAATLPGSRLARYAVTESRSGVATGSRSEIATGPAGIECAS